MTIVNQSGEDTAIKLMGPREWLIEIPAGQERTVLLPSGDYTYVTRYGQDPNFRYSRGTPFQIEQSRIGFTEATLTLISAPSPTYVTRSWWNNSTGRLLRRPETPADKKLRLTGKHLREKSRPPAPAPPKTSPKENLSCTGWRGGNPAFHFPVLLGRSRLLARNSQV